MNGTGFPARTVGADSIRPQPRIFASTRLNAHAPPQGISRPVTKRENRSLSFPLVQSGINIDIDIYIFLYIKVVSGLKLWVVFGLFSSLVSRSFFGVPVFRRSAFLFSLSKPPPCPPLSSLMMPPPHILDENIIPYQFSKVNVISTFLNAPSVTPDFRKHPDERTAPTVGVDYQSTPRRLCRRSCRGGYRCP